jgi:hypothetical protein
MSMAEFLSALAALVAFVTVLGIFLWAEAAREREAARRQWLAELRTWGA